MWAVVRRAASTRDNGRRDPSTPSPGAEQAGAGRSLGPATLDRPVIWNVSTFRPCGAATLK